MAERTADIPPFYLYTNAEPATLPCYPLTAGSPFPFCRINFLVHRFAPQAGPEIPDRLMPTLFLGEQDATAAAALLAQAERAATERGLRSVGMLYVDEDDELARRVLTDRGYACFPHYRAGVHFRMQPFASSCGTTSTAWKRT